MREEFTQQENKNNDKDGEKLSQYMEMAEKYTYEEIVSLIQYWDKVKQRRLNELQVADNRLHWLHFAQQQKIINDRKDLDKLVD